MANMNHLDKQYWRALLTRFALVIISVVIIVWFLPRDEGKLFHYDEGRPWAYGELIAKFDFPVFKTEEALQAERDSIVKNFQPYYNKDSNAGEHVIQKFLSKYQGGLPDVPPTYINIIAKKLDEFYKQGIMEPQEYSQLMRDSSQMIRIVEGKEAVSTNYKGVISTIGAYEQLFQDPTLEVLKPVLQKYNLNEYIDANLKYDKERSETEKQDLLSLIPQASGMVLEGQRIIDRGDIVDAHTSRVLSSLEQAMERRNAADDAKISTIIGQSIYVLILILLFTTYLVLFRKDYFEKPGSIMMLYAVVVLFPILVSLMMQFNKFSVYIIPFAMAPIFVRVFMDSRTAFITHATMTLICAVAVTYQYEFIIVQLVAGLVAIYSLRDLERRSQIFTTAILVVIGSAMVYLALQLIQSYDLSKLDRTIYIHFAINGFLLLFAYPLMLVIEKLFGFTSAVTLFELSNTNNELLRKMSEVAPGTFQHAIMVGNLAAEVANKIGAKSQLVRTGALYHDIGKMDSPAFFTENQAGMNPHNTLDTLESAKIIVSHVSKGLRLAEQNDLPTIIKDFIATHHGKGLAKYFYIKYKNEHPDEEIDETLFCYPGPNPSTREQAILMMCDSVEAASRSLDEYSEKSISELTNRIIDTQVKDGFFTECPITFRDIATTKHILIERLKSIYHTRIQYPEEKQEKPAEDLTEDKK